MMMEQGRTQVGQLRVRQGLLTPARQQTTEMFWREKPKKHWGEELLRNMAVAAALVLCVVTLRSGVLPSLEGPGDVLMTAATDDSLLDEPLGKLSFVSSLFPEAALVFGRSGDDALCAPVLSGSVVHEWSGSEPYTSWQSAAGKAVAAMSGEVLGIYHGDGEERLVQILGEDGLSCLYGNLAEVMVQLGDYVEQGDLLGTAQTGSDVVFEVRRNGVSIDPALYLPQ